VHLAAVQALLGRVLPALESLTAALEAKSQAWAGIVKIGRTHWQDATPLTLGQVFSGYAAQLAHARRHLQVCLPHLCELALGGTAVGTGLNAPAGFGLRVAELKGKFPERKERRRKWFDFEKAARKVIEPELRALLLALPARLAVA
jgi:fumarate hydratase class II